jgi:hypothetical protein
VIDATSIRFWTWELRPANRATGADVAVVRLHVQAEMPVGWNPVPAQAPLGTFQWWVNRYDGCGPTLYGDSFSFWERRAR